MREMFSQRSATLDRRHLVDDRIRKTGKRSNGHNKRERAFIRAGWGVCGNNEVHIKGEAAVRHEGKKEIKYPKNCDTQCYKI